MQAATQIGTWPGTPEHWRRLSKKKAKIQSTNTPLNVELEALCAWPPITELDSGMLSWLMHVVSLSLSNIMMLLRQDLFSWTGEKIFWLFQTVVTNLFQYLEWLKIKLKLISLSARAVSVCVSRVCLFFSPTRFRMAPRWWNKNTGGKNSFLCNFRTSHFPICCASVLPQRLQKWSSHSAKRRSCKYSVDLFSYTITYSSWLVEWLIHLFKLDSQSHLILNLHRPMWVLLGPRRVVKWKYINFYHELLGMFEIQWHFSNASDT